MVGMDAYLETEDGERIDAAGNAAVVSLFEQIPANTICLRFIDLNGNTVFNRGQCRVLFDEWQEMAMQCPAELQPWCDAVLRLISRCRDGVHLYIRFMGD